MVEDGETLYCFQEVDVIPYLTITQTRYEAVEYTKPLSSVAYGLLIAFPDEPPRALIFLKLYKTEVWSFQLT